MDTKAKTELVAMTQALTERLLHRDAGDSRPTIEFTKAQFDELSSRCEAVIVCGGKPHRRFAGHIDDLIWEARARKDRRLKLHLRKRRGRQQRWTTQRWSPSVFLTMVEPGRN